MESALVLPLTDDGDQMRKLQLRSIDSVVCCERNGDKDPSALESGMDCSECDAAASLGKEKCTTTKASSTLRGCLLLTVLYFLFKLSNTSAAISYPSRQNQKVFACRTEAAQLLLTPCSNGAGMKGRCIPLSFEIGSTSTERNGAP